MILILFGFFVAGQQLLAEENWLCVEASSTRDGNVIQSCGIGRGPDENSARLRAFDNAKIEFDKVCESSDDCKGHEVTVKPERTSCSKAGQDFKCYRLIVFTISEREKVVPKREGQPYQFNSTNKNVDNRYPKVKVGMKKGELLKLFGPPMSIKSSFIKGRTIPFYMYIGEMCDYTKVCGVHVLNGKVISIHDFNPLNTDQLD